MSQPKFKYQEFYDRQIEFLVNKDVEGLIINNYTEDAELLNFQYYIKGRAALIEYFKGYIAGLGYIKLISTDKYTEGDSSLMFEATVETAGGIARVYDAFDMRDGKIAKHFTGLLSFTPNAPTS
jgi:hypothetical protein